MNSACKPKSKQRCEKHRVRGMKLFWRNLFRIQIDDFVTKSSLTKYPGAIHACIRTPKELKQICSVPASKNNLCMPRVAICSKGIAQLIIHLISPCIVQTSSIYISVKLFGCEKNRSVFKICESLSMTEDVG